MYFLKKIIFDFPSKEKHHVFGKKHTIFSDNTGKIMLRCDLFEKTIFSELLKKRSYFDVFF